MVLFQPLHEHLKANAYRVLYSIRGVSNRMFKPLSCQPHHTSESHKLLSNVAKVIGQQLALPYVGVTIGSAPRKNQAHMGSPGSELKQFPLRLHDESLGWLEVSFQPGEMFDAEKHRVLETLADQVVVIVKSLQLTAELHAAQQQLVTNREEERRRLQRDLHDGLGSALGAQTLIVGSARRLLKSDPQGADQLLAKLESDMHGTLGQVRQLVYGLRPPELDQLGLVQALRLKLKGLTSGQLRLELILPEPSITYPVAVEVAAYRIVTEAVSNVVRHARARSCRVELRLTETGLEIAITDDGRDFDHQRREVQYSAMRERAHELEGQFSVSSRQPLCSGVRVGMGLPFPPLGERHTHAREGM